MELTWGKIQSFTHLKRSHFCCFVSHQATGDPCQARKPTLLSMKERSYSDSGLDKIGDNLYPKDSGDSDINKRASASSAGDAPSSNDCCVYNRSVDDRVVPSHVNGANSGDNNDPAYLGMKNAVSSLSNNGNCANNHSNVAVIGRPKRGANKLKAASKVQQQQRRSAYGNFAAHLPQADVPNGQLSAAGKDEPASAGGIGNKAGRPAQVSEPF